MLLKVVLYAYMDNVHSCRKIGKRLLRDIHFIWLSGYNKPDFITINRFRNRVKNEIDNIFTQLVLILAGKGFVSLDVGHIDGTKMESKANRHTFVWRKTVGKNRARNCKGCPLRSLCHKAKGDRGTIEANHRLNGYRRKARGLLASEDGIRHRGRRCIEPEAVFGQMKSNMAYRRFRHFGKDKATMDFAFFAIVFNIKKMCSKMGKQTKIGGNTPQNGLFFFILQIIPPGNRIFWQNHQKSVA